MDGPGVNISIVRSQEEVKTVVVANLTAFTHYTVTLTAFTGPLEYANRDGKAIGPVTHQTLEAGMMMDLFSCRSPDKRNSLLL